MKYKVTFGNHLKALEGILFLLLFLLVVFIYIHYYSNIYYPNLLRDLFIFWVISLSPVLYLHIEYYSYNKRIELEIDSYGRKLIYTSRVGKITSYDFDELSKMTICMPPNMYRGSGFQVLPFEQYHYARIYTKSGDEIIFTCLMARKVQEAVGNIKGVPVEKKRRIFASILMG